MKIHFTIEFDKDEYPRLTARASNGKGKPTMLVPVQELNGSGELHITPAAAINAIKKTAPRFAKIATIAPPPIPQEPEPEKKVERKGSGPQFDPGFLKIIQDAPEPFTRRSVSVASGVDVVDVTQRFIRLAKRGWIQQPAKNLWCRTKTFGVKSE
jgi:hypothetical protein